MKVEEFINKYDNAPPQESTLVNSFGDCVIIFTLDKLRTHYGVKEGVVAYLDKQMEDKATAEKKLKEQEDMKREKLIEKRKQNEKQRDSLL